ncbi:LacI family transcriptional regulator [Labrys miyagiensis]|uniref:LacI family transcriptional regulator n=1 Tax=Labrys miyagiensis TaxID=346912 RepID=A0ABQ6CM50_9HYPH|nr:LacI family DNA-binding transcriptional regulator [Labrys miyagiensis]GLS21230.1 LacI family transcriptional regulator [Labrys miyagiensis]
MNDDTDMPSGTVTADHVAAAAGVSRWTVGRAFRKDTSISEKSREKVLAAANALGYAPDLLAAGLASDRSNLIALLVDDFGNPHKLVVLERLSRILNDEGWGTLLCNMRDGHGAPSALLSASQRRVDAAVLNGTEFDDRIIETALGARRVKKLIVFARVSESPNTISICCDDVAAMREITSFVLARGYRTPLFVAGPNSFSAVLRRKDTFLSEWRKARGVLPPSIHVEQYSIPLAYERVLTALTGPYRDARPDILVCENDALAIGAMDAVRFGLGLSIPGDIAVIGYDDIPLAALPSYNLTTYHQPISAMAKGLVKVLESGSEPAEDIFFNGRFVERGTT